MSKEVELLRTASPIACKLYLFLANGWLDGGSPKHEQLGVCRSAYQKALAELTKLTLVGTPKPMPNLTASAAYTPEPKQEEVAPVPVVPPVAEKIVVPVSSHKQGVGGVIRAFNEAFPKNKINPPTAQGMLTLAGGDVESVLTAIDKAVMNKSVRNPYNYVMGILRKEKEEKALETQSPQGEETKKDDNFVPDEEEQERKDKALKIIAMQAQGGNNGRPNIPKRRPKVEAQDEGEEKRPA